MYLKLKKLNKRNNSLKCLIDSSVKIYYKTLKIYTKMYS